MLLQLGEAALAPRTRSIAAPSAAGYRRRES